MSNDSGYVFYGTLNAAQLTELSGALFPDDATAAAIVRSVADACFVGITEAEPTTWPEAHVFGPSADLRWHPNGEANAFSVLLLQERGNAPEGYDLRPLNGSDLEACPEAKVDGAILLWGKRPIESRNAYAEARIPRLLRYPRATGETPPRIVYQLYRDRSTRAVKWTRLVRMEADNARL